MFSHSELKKNFVRVKNYLCKRLAYFFVVFLLLLLLFITFSSSDYMNYLSLESQEIAPAMFKVKAKEVNDKLLGIVERSLFLDAELLQRIDEFKEHMIDLNRIVVATKELALELKADREEQVGYAMNELNRLSGELIFLKSTFKAFEGSILTEFVNLKKILLYNCHGKKVGE